MTNRTASLLMLFAAALIVSGPLVGIVLRVVPGQVSGSAAIAPAVALLCFTAVFYFGRRFILPPDTHRSSLRALGTLFAILAVTMVVAFGIGWVLNAAIGGISISVPAFVLWFAALWWVITMLNRRRRGSLAV